MMSQRELINTVDVIKMTYESDRLAYQLFLSRDNSDNSSPSILSQLLYSIEVWYDRHTLVMICFFVSE